MRNEATRVREQGTIVTNTTQAEDPGMARIEAIKRIVEQGQYAKIDGVMVDLFTASAIAKVYEALNQDNQKKFRDCPIQKMSTLAFKLLS